MQTRLIYETSKSSRIKAIDAYIKKCSREFNVKQEDLEIYYVEKDISKKNIAIDQVRKVIENVKIKPANSQCKIVVISDAQYLSIEGQNALLKIIEEPPSYAQIILAVDSEDNLLPTIKSRCIKVNAKTLVADDVYGELTDGLLLVDEDSNSPSKSEIDALLKSNLGKKIDWLTDNKKQFSDSAWVNSLLDQIEIVLRDNLIDLSKNGDIGNDKTQKKYVEFIEEINKIKKNIRNNNVNAFLNVEALLVGLPRIKV